MLDKIINKLVDIWFWFGRLGMSKKPAKKRGPEQEDKHYGVGL